ncbi:DUF4271 domain-containing protein [Mesonia algae]
MEHNNWVTLTFLFVLLLVLVSNQLYPEKFTDFRNLFFSGKYFTSHQKKPSVFNFFSFILYLSHSVILSLGLFTLFKVMGFLKVEYNFLFFLQIFILLNVLIGIKYLVEKIIASIFTIDKVIDNYIFYKITYKNLLAFTLFPVLLVFIYSWTPSPITLIISTLLYLLLNLFILLKYYLKNQKLVFKYSFYFILYLCTLEIAPYIILYKVIT